VLPTMADEGLIGVEGVEGVDKGVPLILLATIIMAFACTAPTTQQYLNLNLSLKKYEKKSLQIWYFKDSNAT
jgi:hypothetical protein